MCFLYAFDYQVYMTCSFVWHNVCSLSFRNHMLNIYIDWIMKKVLFAVALVMGLGSSVAFAGNMVSDVEIVVMVNDYKPIEVKDLPQAVQDTIKKDFADLTIKEAAVEESEEGTKTYKVTFTDAEGTDSEVFFNEKGEVLK